MKRRDGPNASVKPKRLDRPSVSQRILSVQPGQIVLMHDGGGDRSQTVEALRIALPQLKEQGYRFVTVDEMLEYGVAGGASEG